MADILYLKDGTSEVVIGKEADVLRNLIEAHLGRDCADSFDRCLQNKAEDTVENMDDYEQDCEALERVCHDAVDALDDTLKLFEQPRLNKAMLKKALQKIRHDINWNL